MSHLDNLNIEKLLIFKNWADDLYLKYAAELTDEQFYNKTSIVDKSVQSILYHMYEVYWFWFHNATDKNYSDEPSPDSTRDELIIGIKQINKDILELARIPEKHVEFNIQWDKKDKPVTTNTMNILINFLFHSAYHRGQLALLLRHHGYKTIDETDFNPYLYQKGQN
jgi:uncharacterized damage-inducible protein DinB